MTSLLTSTFTDHAARARTWRPGDDPTALRDALALAAAIGATGGIERIPLATRRDLAARGRRFLAGGEPAGEDGAIVAAIARAGLDALSGATATAATARPRSHPSALDLVRMTRGEPDPLAAGATALHVRRCDRCSDEIALVVATAAQDAPGREPAEPVLLAAAAEPAPMRDPAEGRRVAALAAPEVEAVLFESGGTRRLAVYGDRRTPLRLVAPGVVTEDALGGYWIGRIDPGAATLEATLHAGDDTIAWRIVLS